MARRHAAGPRLDSRRGAVLRDPARGGRRGHHLVRAVCALPAHHRRIVTSDEAPSPAVRATGRSPPRPNAPRRPRPATSPSSTICPLPADTANLREGANLNDALLALLPLVGVWRGEGEGRGSHGDYRFGQQIVVSHDGGDYLNWEARSWRLTEAGDYEEHGLRETGFWRFVNDPNDPARVPGDRTAAGPFGRLRRAVLRAPAQPVVVGTGHRCAGPQQVRDAGRRRQTVVRHRRGRRLGLRRGARRRRRRTGSASVGPAVAVRRLVAPSDNRCRHRSTGPIAEQISTKVGQ